LVKLIYVTRGQFIMQCCLSLKISMVNLGKWFILKPAFVHTASSVVSLPYAFGSLFEQFIRQLLY